MQRLKHWGFLVTIYGIMGVMGIVGLPVVLWTRRLAHNWMVLYSRAVFAIAGAFYGVRLEVRGPVPTGEVVVAAKHQSMLDVFALFACMPDARFVMKRSLLWTPIFGLYTWRAGMVAIDREARGQGQKVLRHVAGPDGAGRQIVIYPQGTRVAPHAEAPYRRGAGMLYRQLGLPMVLAATNAGVFWPKHGLMRGPGTLVIEFLETLPPGLPGRQVMARCEAAVEAASDALVAEAEAELGR